MAGTDTSVGERTVRDELGKEGKDLEWQAQKLELYSLCGQSHWHRNFGKWPWTDLHFRSGHSTRDKLRKSGSRSNKTRLNVCPRWLILFLKTFYNFVYISSISLQHSANAAITHDWKKSLSGNVRDKTRIWIQILWIQLFLLCFSKPFYLVSYWLLNRHRHAILY